MMVEPSSSRGKLNCSFEKTARWRNRYEMVLTLRDINSA